MVFALNGTVTLTFDLVTLKFIGSSIDHEQSSYKAPWLSLLFFSNILSRHGFCIKCFCDLDL